MNWDKKAIEAAVQGNWQKAIEINQKIVKKDSKNIPALNRLGRAYWEANQNNLSRKTYQKVIKLDQYNPIANKNLQRLAKKAKINSNENKKLPDAEVFLEEPRKTKIVRVIRLTSPQRLAEVDSGDKVQLVPKKRFIAVHYAGGIHLGSLPEDLSQRLIAFMKGGNHYEAFVKKVEPSRLEILIRETARGARFKNIPSF